MTHATLPPLPPTIGLLTTSQSQTLNRLNAASIISVKNCRTCKGTQTFRWYVPISTRDDANIGEYQCNCEDQYQLSRWLSYAGVPISYQELGWADFNHLPQAVLEGTMDYLSNSTAYIDAGMGLVFSGTKGSGKTLAANLVMKELIANGVRGRVISFNEMIEKFAEGWKDKAAESWFRSEVESASVLFVDDIGRERNKGETSVGTTMFENVLRRRVQNKQPTILTTNLTSAEIGQGYGGNTMSLLSEVSTVISIAEPDRRDEVANRHRHRVAMKLSPPVVIS